jgi:hypothetical protein
MEGWKLAPNDLEQEQTLTDKVQLNTGNQNYFMQFKFIDMKITDQSRNFLTFKELGNPFQGINSAKLCSLAGRYDNPIPSRFLASIDCLKILALVSVDSWTSCHGHDNPSHIGRHVWSCQVYC